MNTKRETALTSVGNDRRDVRQYVVGLTELASARIADGWHPSFVTIMFDQMPGGPGAIIARMDDAVDRLFRTFVTNVCRRPASPRSVGGLPIYIGAPDRPVMKRRRSGPAGPDLVPNDGWHMHGLLLIPPHSRLRVAADEHFRSHHRLYAKPPIERVDVRPVVGDVERVLDYLLKTVGRGSATLDDLLILPRALSEMRD
jgi:hypothetical protein